MLERKAVQRLKKNSSIAIAEFWKLVLKLQTWYVEFGPLFRSCKTTKFLFFLWFPYLFLPFFCFITKEFSRLTRKRNKNKNEGKK
jgi:hypothetical protein